jgi:PAS domain S-box-containing protein
VQNITRYYLTDVGTVIADGVCIDISERGEAETNLQRTNELLKAVIKAVPVAIDIISPEGKVLLWNAAAERLFAWNISAVVGYPVLGISEVQGMELQAAILDTLAGRPLDGVEVALQRSDGSWTNVNMSTVLVHDHYGKIIGVLRIIDELADRNVVEKSYSNGSSSGIDAIANLVTGKANPLLEQYKTGQRNFAGLNLRGANFIEADLQHGDFSGAALNGSNCNHANFQYAKLRGADLRGSNLQDADLQWADLSGADLRGADLRGTNLSNANTIGAIIDENFAKNGVSV